MPKFDQKSNTQVAVGLVATLSGTTPAKGNIVDCSGFEAITFLVNTGTVTDAGTAAGFAFEVQESDTTADAAFTAVADADLVGLESALTVTDDAADGVAVGSIGYVGDKRYVRIVATGTTGTNAVVNVAVAKQRPQIGSVSPTFAANIAAT